MRACRETGSDISVAERPTADCCQLGGGATLTLNTPPPPSPSGAEEPEPSIRWEG